MDSENILAVNVPNFITIGIMVAALSVLFCIAKKYLPTNGG